MSDNASTNADESEEERNFDKPDPDKFYAELHATLLELTDEVMTSLELEKVLSRVSN